MNELSIKVKRKYVLYTFLLSFLLKSVVYLRNTDISLIADNIGDLALPTYLAGLNWSRLVSDTSYYGYGFKWVYAIFFWLTDNPFVIYVGIEFLHIILQCVLASVIYIFSVKYWWAKQDWLTIVSISIVMSTASISMASEAHIFLAFFVLCMLMVSLVRVEEIGRKRIFSVITGLWSCYMITLHERCLAVVIAVVLLILLWRVYEKKWLVDLKLFIPALIVAYLIQENLTNYIIDLFWSEKSATGTLANTSVLSSNMLWFIESFDNFMIFIQAFLTNLYTLIIKSYGTGVLAITFTFAWIMNLFTKKKNVVKEICDENKEIFVVLLLSAFATFIVLSGVAVRWGGTVAKGDLYGYKGFSYGRYYIVFAWPGVLGITLLWREIKNYHLKLLRVIAAGLILLLSLVFAVYLFPHLQAIREQGGYNAFVYMSYFEDIKGMEERARYLFVTIVVMLILTTLLLLKKTRYMIVYIALVMGLILFVKTQGFHIAAPTIQCSYFQASYDCIADVEDNIELPDVLYYYGHKPFNCQFMLNRYAIDVCWANESMEDAIIFSRKAPDVVAGEIELNNEYYYTQLGNEEYLYIKGEFYFKQFSGNGYLMKKIEK